MSTEEHERILIHFRRVCELEGPRRAAYLERLDDETRCEVDSLLEHDLGEESEEGELQSSASVLRLQSAVGSLLQHATPPEKLGDFRVIEVVGSGGMGIVYRAEQDNPHRTVALKVIRPEYVTEEALRRFKFEAEALARLKHPGIAQIYEVGEDSTMFGVQPFFAMELVEGKPLLEWTHERELSIRERLEIFVQICDAVVHAHQNSVVHLDLKPGNILVEVDGRPRVLDFGIARFTDPDRKATTQITDAGRLLGTVTYMSPEQASSDPSLDTRTDVYSLGVMLYELLSGQLPYDIGDSPLPEALRAITEDAPVPLGRRSRALSGDLETITAKALEKDRNRRYQSASAFGADVERFLADRPIEARPASVLYLMWKFSRRHRAVTGGVLATALALTAGLAGTLWWAREAEKESRALEEQLEETLRFSDRVVLGDLNSDFERRLHPRRPRLYRDFEDWLRRAAEVMPHLERHRASLGQIERDILAAHPQLAAIPGPEDDPLWRDIDHDLRFRYWTFHDLVDRIEQLDAKAAEIKARLEYATWLERVTVDSLSSEWQLATQRVRHDPRFRGFELRPQIGLHPLGPDSRNGLEEFWLVESGSQPERNGPDNTLKMCGDSGLVFVLLPGGESLIGSSREPGPNFDPEQRPDEHLRRIQIGPFFMSKYELTQGQWFALSGERPSTHTMDQTLDDHPVECVSWQDCHSNLRRWGLRLPSESEWEYAHRAGTTTAYSSGPDARSVEGYGNFADRDFKDGQGGVDRWEEWLRDGHVKHAPVGSFRGNAFGLHDTAGNVLEWCMDWYHDRRDMPQRDPVCLVRPDDLPQGFERPGRVLRGGAFCYPAQGARSSLRSRNSEAFGDQTTGVRPALSIED